MALGQNISLLYFSMAVFLWLGGVNSGDASMEATGKAGIGQFMTVGENNTFQPNATIGNMTLSGEEGSVQSGSFIQTPDGWRIVKTGVMSLTGFITGPFGFLIDAGLPMPIAVAFGGGLFVLGLVSIISFVRGKDF